jgi:CheY-like chemotaxis protein
MAELAEVSVVAVAETPAEAIAALEEHRNNWQLAVVDLFLREGSGLAVLRAARPQRRVYMRAWNIFTGAAPVDDKPMATKQAQTALAAIAMAASALALIGHQSVALSTLVVASSFVSPFTVVTIVECWQQMFVK